MPVDLGPLFTPFQINQLVLPNRFVMPAMQRLWCVNGRPPQRLAEYYQQRFEGGVGLIITESCAVDHPSATQLDCMGWMREDTADAWAVCLAHAKSTGGSMLMQLCHEGAVRKEGGEGPHAAAPTLSPSGLIKAGKEAGRPATLEELAAIQDAFVRSARLAQQIGFDGVEIHGSHGFLLDQFLWHETNHRTDRYGGDVVARARFPAETVAAVRRATGPKFLISFRLSQWKEQDYGAQIAATPGVLARMLRVLREAGTDVFHVSARRFGEPAWPNSERGIAGWAKALTDAPVIGVGSVGLDVDVMDNLSGTEAKSTGEAGLRELAQRFANGEFDLIAVGRSQIGDPQWVRKVREGRLADIRGFTKHDIIGDQTLADFNHGAAK